MIEISTQEKFLRPTDQKTYESAMNRLTLEKDHRCQRILVLLVVAAWLEILRKFAITQSRVVILVVGFYRNREAKRK